MKSYFLSPIVFLFVSTVLILLNSCGSDKTYDELNKADWLIGAWENQTNEGYSIEIWSKENDSVFVGVSYFIIDSDTVFSESIRIEQNGDDLYYIPSVNGQNDGESVSFKMTNSNENELVFENLEHDFPQKITYSKKGKNALMAVISGLVNGQEMVREFPMERKK